MSSNAATYDFVGKTAVVTGAGSGIGRSIATGLVAAGARVVAVDLNADGVAETVDNLGEQYVVGLAANIATLEGVEESIALAEKRFGPVDLYVANAGVWGGMGLDASDAQWDQALDVNVRAHVVAARVLVPGWVARGSGYFVSVASAAGLLTQIGSATYSVSKHAAVGFAEWLSITYGDNGIGVSCVCPMGVQTALLDHSDGDPRQRQAVAAVTSAGAVLGPDEVAETVLAGIAAGDFLVLPHPQVLEMYRQKSNDYGRWIRGMRRYQAQLGD